MKIAIQKENDNVTMRLLPCVASRQCSLFFQKRGEAIYAAKGDMLPDTYMYKIFKSTAELKIRYGYGMYFSAYVEVATARRTA